MKRLDRIRDRIAGWLYDAAYRISAPERGVPCLDCGAPVPDGVDCQVCIDGWEQQKFIDGIYGSGYDDGHREASAALEGHR